MTNETNNQAKKVQKVPKTIGKRYVVKVNNESVSATESLKEARAYITTLALNSSVANISIVKETVTETVLTNWAFNSQDVVTANELDSEIA